MTMNRAMKINESVTKYNLQNLEVKFTKFVVSRYANFKKIV